MMVLQQWGLFETNSRLRKFPSTFLFSHSFILVVSLFGYLVVFFRKCLAAWVSRFTHFDRVLPLCLNCTFHCSVTYKTHFGFCDMHIYSWTPTSSPLPCYTFCIGMFRYIQFDSRCLTSPREPVTLF
jgi:hypothetical protein